MTSPELEELVRSLLDICRRVDAKGFVAATDGNISARLPGGNILATPTSLNKGFVEAGDLVEITPDGAHVAGRRKASTELDMHLFIYKNRPDVNAVVHCHPVYATGFAAARIPMTECLLPEMIVGLGGVPLAPYATPSTHEVSEAIAPYVQSADAILLANHGVVTYGKDLWDAYFKMEKVEQAAHIQFVAKMLGGEKPLSPDDLARLRAVSVDSYGIDFSGKPSCDTAPQEPSAEFTDKEYQTIVEEVKKRLSQSP